MTAAEKRYEREARKVQAAARVPALSVAVHRADRGLWTCTVGESGDPARPLDAGSRFRIGSVTKTFTAVLIMQARDDGLLDLDDPVGKHLDLPAHGDATIRRLLSHTAGFQREPHGDVWDMLEMPSADRMIAEIERAERVLPNARRYHYSNLALGVLGQMVARLRGGSWFEVLSDRVLTPLGLASTSYHPTEDAVVGWLVDAYSDAARPEPVTDMAGAAPAAQLWSTAADMATWAAFLADPQIVDPDGKVLAAATVDEMRWPLTTTDEQLWVYGFGLGLILQPAGKRILHVGHDGAMPGFLSAVYGRRGGDGNPGALGCAVLASSGTAMEIAELPHDLLRLATELDPAEIKPWRIGEPAPERYQPVLGRWWGEGFPYEFSWHDGALQARAGDAPADRPPAVFEPSPDDPDVLRTVSGREAGELLRITRDEHGVIVRMHWATYRFTRVQEAFDGLPPSRGEHP